MLTLSLSYYYQHSPNRLQTCTVNLHYLLHVVDSIENLGPVWCYWSFPMERFCSLIGSCVKSRRHPYQNITRSIRDQAQLRILRLLYGSHEGLQFLCHDPEDEDNPSNADTVPGCKWIKAES